MALEMENVLNFSNPIYPFEQQVFHDPYNELFLPMETELPFFDPLDQLPVLDIDQSFWQLDQLINDHQSYDLFLDVNNYDHRHELASIKNNFQCQYYPSFDITPPMQLPTTTTTECKFPFNGGVRGWGSMQLALEGNFSHETEVYYCPQNEFLPTFPKKRKFDQYIDEYVGSEYLNDHCYDNGDTSTTTGDSNGSGSGNYGEQKAVSTQNKNARERRKRIADKTQELRKLVPGGTKMYTAEMLQSAFKYVKFLQAQLGLLQTLDKLQKENDQKINSKHLSILASDVVQEKLYSKGKCLIPMEFLPLLKKNCDFDINLQGLDQ